MKKNQGGVRGGFNHLLFNKLPEKCGESFAKCVFTVI